MGNRLAPSYSGKLVQLILRGRGPQALVQTGDDWEALGAVAERMLFWCGGAIHGCRCQGNEMRFAVQVSYASIGAMAQHISLGYARRLHQERGSSGNLFKHYIAVPLHDELFLDDLVMWLHRRPDLADPQIMTSPLWTGDGAYLNPHFLTWISTDRVLRILSIGAPGSAAYRRRKAEPFTPEILKLLTRANRNQRTKPTLQANDPSSEPYVPRPDVQTIARAVADHCHVSFEDMRSKSRKRTASRAKVIATVLCTRNGATAAAAARLFGRSRSTLIEQAEHYRKTEPHIFADAETALETFLEVLRQ